MTKSKKKAPAGKRRMQQYGYKALTTFVKDDIYFRLDKRVRDLELSKSKYLQQLIEQDLKAAGYIRFEDVSSGTRGRKRSDEAGPGD